MPSARKNRRQKVPVKRTNVKRQWKNLKKKKRSTNFDCAPVKAAWDTTKTVKQNMSEIGIAFNANDSMAIKRPQYGPTFIPNVVKKQKIEVIKEMEMEADLGEKEKRFQLPSEDVHFCTYMMEKHQENYKAMARDRKNMYQLTPKQIRNKIREFKRSKIQYQSYLDSKKTETMDTV